MILTPSMRTSGSLSWLVSESDRDLRGPSGPMRVAARVPLSNPPRLRDFLAFQRPRAFAFRASWPGARGRPSGSGSGSSAEPSRAGGASGPRGRLEPVQEVLTARVVT
jgi:hypothetical protein